MHVDFLLEEESAEAALNLLLPKLLPSDCTFACIPHQGKDDLLRRLPGRLKNYARLLPANAELRVVVMMDADANCQQRKKELERLVAAAGLLTKASAAAAGQAFQVITRLAVTELEAWFLGDRAAIQAAYSRVHPNHFKGIHPVADEIPDAWETLWRVLKSANLYLAGKAKVEWATAIAPHLDPTRNTSVSFHYFCEGLTALR
jgi:hypothetical protein